MTSRLFLLVGLASAVAAAPAPRTIFAWASANPAAAAQLRNASWEGVFDGVQAYCGFGFDPVNGTVVVNATQLAACAPLRAAASAAVPRIQFHACLNAVPEAAIANPGASIASAVAAAQAHGLDGFSIDDESDCAPRSTLRNFTRWAGYVDALAGALHGASAAAAAGGDAPAPAAAAAAAAGGGGDGGGGFALSAAVQAMFGIQDVPYAPGCQPAQDPSCSQACDRAPWAYAAEPRVAALMKASRIDRWLEMDTYYFGTGRFLNALDWYADALLPVLPAAAAGNGGGGGGGGGGAGGGNLGVAVMNRDDISADGYLARFHALEKSGADWLNVFLLPASDAWLPFLRRWKSRCAGCGKQSALGCYELTVPCGEEEPISLV